MLNIITILALRKTSSLSKPLKTLLLSLAVSDLGVGLLVQPLYVAYLAISMEQNTETQTFKITLGALQITGSFLSYASFFGGMALSAGRFLAIHYYLRYQELVTPKRVVAAVISVWVLSVIVSLIAFSGLIPENIGAIIGGTIECVCYLTTAFFYFKIYLAVRHHSNQIHVLQAQLAHNGEVIANVMRQKKSAVGAFYLYLVFVACYLPHLCIWVNHLTTGLSTATWHLSFYFYTLLLLNSSLNPLIYSWKMTDIRHAVMDILRNIFPCHN